MWGLKFVGFSFMILVGNCFADYTNFLERCTKEKNTVNCLKKKAVDVLDRATTDNSIYVINDYVSIAKDPTVVNSRQYQSANDNDNKTVSSLDEQLEQKFYQFLSSRSIKLTIPGDAFQGRKKKDKGGYGGALMAGGVAMAVWAQLIFGKIALIAGTALLTAKIALVLSAIIGLKKLISSGNGGGGHEVIYATASDPHGSYGGGYGGWQRSFPSSIPIH